MCEVVSGAMAVLGAASSLMQGSAARKGAKAEAAYKNKLAIQQNENYRRLTEWQQDYAEWQADTYAKVAASAQQDYNQQVAAMVERVGQIRDQALETIQQYSMQSDQAKSQMRVSAAENETTGNSVRLARQVYDQAEAQQTRITYKNLESSIRQSQRQLLSLQAQTQSRVNQARPGPLQPINPQNPIAPTSVPNMLPYVVQAGSAAVSAWAYQQNLDAQRPPTTGGLGSPTIPQGTLNNPFPGINPLGGTGGYA